VIPREDRYVSCGELRFSRHAVQRMFERNISVDDVREVILTGETIEAYPDDQPWPSRLVLLRRDDRVLHAVIAEAPGEICYIIIVYEPDPNRWTPGFRSRKA
jgi:hypothetical protein